MELGQDAIMGFARAVAEPREARRSTSDATVTRVEDGVAYVALPGGEGDTPVAQSAASVEVGDAVTVEWRGNALHLTGNVSAPSVGGAYVQQRISPVEAEAQIAAEAAARAGEAADSAAVAAGNAQSSANAAAAAAGSAQASADNASEYAARALGNLSTVQSVTETLAWITQHGTMALTADTEPDPTHVYFVADAGGDYVVGSAHYSLVIEPVAADMATYYELTIDESLNNYVGTHLALTAEGLWLLPASSGAYRILIATGAGTTYTEAGTYIIDANGNSVAKFGTVTRVGMAPTFATVAAYFENTGMSIRTKENVSPFPVINLAGIEITDGTMRINTSLTFNGPWSYEIPYEPVRGTDIDVLAHLYGYKTICTFTAGTSGTYTSEYDKFTYDGNVTITYQQTVIHASELYFAVRIHRYYSVTNPTLYVGTKFDGFRARNTATIGMDLLASGENQLVVGRDNVADFDNAYALIIGNGTSDSSRSNALTVDWDGNVTMAGKLTADGVTVPCAQSTLTVNTTNATAGNTNMCLFNGIMAAVYFNFSLKAALASGAAVTVATVPSAYRPPYSMPCNVYVSSVITVVAVVSGMDGVITVRNMGSNPIAAGKTVRIGCTYMI